MKCKYYTCICDVVKNMLNTRGVVLLDLTSQKTRCSKLFIINIYKKTQMKETFKDTC